jgi:hypothetical protein
MLAAAILTVHSQESFGMTRIGLALRSFFRILFNAAFAAEAARLFQAPAPPVASAPQAAEAPAAKKAAPAKAPPSQALSLLAALQREARFVDFIQEPIAGYSDAQIGAAVRDVHRECRALIERVFALRPVVEAAEGAEIDVPGGTETGRYRLIGNVSGQPPFRGKLCHHGWEASATNLPEWTGTEAQARVIAPAEVEVK